MSYQENRHKNLLAVFIVLLLFAMTMFWINNLQMPKPQTPDKIFFTPDGRYIIIIQNSEHLVFKIPVDSTGVPFIEEY